jgi:3-methyladenine DNA glycosylase AlkC
MKTTFKILPNVNKAGVMSMHTASSHSKKICSKCEKSAGSFSCDGCGQSFCLKHVAEHRQEIICQMDNIEQEHDIFHDDLLNQAKKQNEHILFNRIDRWEKESIEKIQQTADESRTKLKQILDSIIDYGQKSLNKISLKLRRAREFDDFFENDLNRWTEQINHLRAEIEAMSNSIDITHDNSTSVIQFIKIVHDQTIAIPVKIYYLFYMTEIPSLSV